MSQVITSAVTGSNSVAECLDELAWSSGWKRPLCTYRLQFHRGFTFEDAGKLVPYLKQLGISHIYASPILQAREGSTHGYDIAHHNKISAEAGGEEGLRSLVSELRRNGMGLIVDTVPNHMGVGKGDNPWWQDVLENGEASEFAQYFDIDWSPLKPELKHRVLLPILASQYGEELEEGRLQLAFENGLFEIRYYDVRLPIDPQTIPLIFDEPARRQLLPMSPAPEISQFRVLLSELSALPPHSAQTERESERRRQLIPKLMQRFTNLADRPAIRSLIQEATHAINGTVGKAESFDLLHRLLEAQSYRLAHWRVSGEEINYRRFFDINDLVGLRMENPRVFAATHALMRRLLAEGLVDGLRIDHCDGLLNPVQYLVRLQMLYAAAHCAGPEPVGPAGDNGIELEVQEYFSGRVQGQQRPALYCLVEKILEPGEELPVEWPVDGTSGYDFLNLVNGIFLQRRSERQLTTLYHRFTGGSTDVERLIYESKKLVMESALSSEVSVLTHILSEISSHDRRARDFTLNSLRDAITETIACFPVYRTYIDERGTVTERDMAYITGAAARAKRRNPETSGAVYDFLREILLLRGGMEEQAQNRLYFTLKFQQLTGPVMAKGLEDTVCYVYNRFISVNEVGSTPKQFGVSLDEFHQGNVKRLRFWPDSMLATSTHDTKRSEDVRARLNVLSEMPKQWSQQVLSWRRAQRKRKRIITDGRSVPDHNEEYLLYQTLVGTWPMQPEAARAPEFRARIAEYMDKAVHEAKRNLSWINDDPEYVSALREFVERLLTDEQFLKEAQEFCAAPIFFGALNSLAQTLLKLTAPGVPDIYQGNECWALNLVDPDNRRPVDFGLRQKSLCELGRVGTPELCRRLLQNFQDGRVKMWLTRCALSFRQDDPELFRKGKYQPVRASGRHREHICAFLRSDAGGQQKCVVAVPRLSYSMMGGQQRWPLGDAWADTALNLPFTGELTNLFTGERLQCDSRVLPCRDLFRDFPLAMLVG